jgi:hypothetical protein
MPFLHQIFEQNNSLSGFAGILIPLEDLAAAIFPNTVDRKGLSNQVTSQQLLTNLSCITKRKKPFSDGEIVKEATISAAETV